MSNDQHTDNDHTDHNDHGGDERSDTTSNVILRALPAVTFGLRAAALAGLVISTGALATGLAGMSDGGPTVELTITTCCS